MLYAKKQPIKHTIRCISYWKYCSDSTRGRVQHKQFPVALTYALMIDKAQGQLLHHMRLLLHTNIFAHGQLYMAFSHAKDPKTIIIWIPSKNKNKLINKVWMELYENWNVQVGKTINFIDAI